MFEPDADAEYEQTITIDLSWLKPMVAFPAFTGNTKTIDEVGDVKIDQVVDGSRTNAITGKISDPEARLCNESTRTKAKYGNNIDTETSSSSARYLNTAETARNLRNTGMSQ